MLSQKCSLQIDKNLNEFIDVKYNICDFLSGQVYQFVNEKTVETYFSNKKEKVNKKLRYLRCEIPNSNFIG